MTNDSSQGRIGESNEILDYHEERHRQRPGQHHMMNFDCPCGASVFSICRDCNEPVFVARHGDEWCTCALAIEAKAQSAGLAWRLP